MAPTATRPPTLPFRKLFWGPSVRDCKNHRAPKVEEKVEKAPICQGPLPSELPSQALALGAALLFFAT